MSAKWNVGGYLRLSSEDGDKITDSNSILNQKELVQQFIDSNDDITLYNFYIDDGFTGTNFNRPGFMRMLEDIKSGKINAVIVKDLSRLGRNYIEVGNYIEHIFPLLDVRFISITDNIDSIKRPDSLNNVIVSFKNVVNDEYCRDISKKVKSAITARVKRGEFAFGCSPYGYVKSLEEKNKLIIDEYSANIVREIFKLYLEGNGSIKIAKYLNEKNILPPLRYNVEQLDIKYRKNKSVNKYNPNALWSASAVTKVLRNRVYCGDLVANKTVSISYKIKRKVSNNPNDVIIVEDAFEPIIDRDTFNKVQEMLSKNNTNKNNSVINRNKDVPIFKNILKCGDCKMRMVRHKNVGSKRTKIDYYCDTYVYRSSKMCSSHKINEQELEDLLLPIINFQIKLIVDINNSIKKISKLKNNNGILESIENQIKNINFEINNKNNERKIQYENWKFNKITDKEYYFESMRIDNELEKLNSKIDSLNYEISILSNDNNIYKNWIKKYMDYRNIDKIDKNVIEDLIEKIYVYDNKNIEVVFKYKNEYERALNYITNNKEMNDKI